MKSNKTKAYASILIGAALWGGIGVFFRMVSDTGISSMQSVAIRVVLAAVFYSAYLAVTDRQSFKIRLRDLPLFIGSGVCSLVFFNFCYFRAIEISGSMGIAAVLLYTAPIFVMLMSAVLFKEKLTAIKAIALVMTFGGCLLVTGVLGSGVSAPITAIVYGLGSGFGYALYSIFGTYALRRCSSKTVIVYSFICGAVVLLPFLPFSALPSLMTPHGVVGSVGLSVVCCVLPYIFYTYGLKLVEPGKASMLATIEPVVAAVLGVALFNEMPTVSLIMGIIVVVAAISILNFGEKVKKP